MEGSGGLSDLKMKKPWHGKTFEEQKAMYPPGIIVGDEENKEMTPHEKEEQSKEGGPGPMP